MFDQFLLQLVSMSSKFLTSTIWRSKTFRRYGGARKTFDVSRLKYGKPSIPWLNSGGSSRRRKTAAHEDSRTVFHNVFRFGIPEEQVLPALSYLSNDCNGMKEATIPSILLMCIQKFPRTAKTMRMRERFKTMSKSFLVVGILSSDNRCRRASASSEYLSLFRRLPLL